MNSHQQELYFDTEENLTNVIVDAEHVLLAEIFDEKTKQWWFNQLKAPLYMDQKIALQNIDSEFIQQAAIKTLKHKYWEYVYYASKASAIKNQY